MVNPERIKALCHPEVFKRIPVGEVEQLHIQHIRRSFGDSEFASKGGHTKADFYVDGIKYHGIAVCSNNDNYCKKTGRELAFKRACRHYWDSVK